jgi:hypothetical protein
MKLPSILTFSGLALTCQSVFAAEAVSTPATGFLQIMLALLFVIALMLALAWVMKRVPDAGAAATGHEGDRRSASWSARKNHGR